MAKPQAARAHGTVVKLMPDKGFGFIQDDQGAEYFFHRSALSTQAWANLQLTDGVTFIIQENPKGLRAEAVEPDSP